MQRKKTIYIPKQFAPFALFAAKNMCLKIELAAKDAKCAKVVEFRRDCPNMAMHSRITLSFIQATHSLLFTVHYSLFTAFLTSQFLSSIQ